MRRQSIIEGASHNQATEAELEAWRRSVQVEAEKLRRRGMPLGKVGITHLFTEKPSTPDTPKDNRT